MAYSNKVDLIIVNDGCAEALIALHEGDALNKATEKSEKYGELERKKIKATPKSLISAIVCLSAFFVVCAVAAATFILVHLAQEHLVKSAPLYDEDHNDEDYRYDDGDEPRLDLEYHQAEPAPSDFELRGTLLNDDVQPDMDLDTTVVEIDDNDEQESQIWEEEKVIKVEDDLKKWLVEDKEKGNPHAESAPSVPTNEPVDASGDHSDASGDHADHSRPLASLPRHLDLNVLQNGEGVDLSHHSPRFQRRMRHGNERRDDTEKM